MPLLPPTLDLIRQLIALPSVSSVSPDYDQGNLAVVHRLAHWLEDLGFACELQPLPGRSDKANLIAVKGSGPGGLVLSGHTDTVPFDPGRWRYDPFAGIEMDGRLYGLGSADMKSFLALAVDTIRRLGDFTPQAPLIVLATADEESSMAGARALADSGRPLGRYAVIGEPTGLRPVRMHKGVMMEAIRITGRSGHSSDPSLGNSALEGMTKVLNAILDWRAHLQRNHRDPGFAVDVPTLNLGRIQGGDNPNRICAHCELHIDIRPLPGMRLDDLRHELRERLMQVLGESGLGLSVTPLFAGVEAMSTPADADLVRTAERLTGHSAGSVAFGTEAPFLTAMGMETVILGPGDIAQAHQPDEFIQMSSLEPTVELLGRLIRHYCLMPHREMP